MSKILITGSTGFLGAATIAELLDRKMGQQLLLLVRAENRVEGLTRIREKLLTFEVPLEQIEVLNTDNVLLGDLLDPTSFCNNPLLDQVTHVLNCAAITSFGNNPQIWPVNVDGTFAFAKRMSRAANLKRFLHIGTAMACGPSVCSPITESWQFPDEEEHLVQYTASKAAIEYMLHTNLPNLPLVVARPSIVVGHTRLGCQPSSSIFWVFRMGQLLQKFTCALDEKIDVIPVDYCASAAVDLLLKPALANNLYHISAGEMSSCSFAAIEENMAAALNMEPIGNRYRQICEDDFVDVAREFEARLGRCNRRLVLRALKLYAGFAELNYVFDNSRLLAEGISAPPRFSEYAGLCARTTSHLSIQEQMQWDFK